MYSDIIRGEHKLDMFFKFIRSMLTLFRINKIQTHF